MKDKDITKLLRTKASKEPFAQLLDLKVLDIRSGYARVQMQVDEKKLIQFSSINSIPLSPREGEAA